ncbi:MAG: FAD-dependent oxidoreductase [Eggerthellaceae bacterium]
MTLRGSARAIGQADRPRSGPSSWAAVQLRAENSDLTAYNLVRFQTNLTFPEQRRVFRMIGVEHAEFAIRRHAPQHVRVRPTARFDASRTRGLLPCLFV